MAENGDKSAKKRKATPYPGKGRNVRTIVVNVNTPKTNIKHENGMLTIPSLTYYPNKVTKQTHQTQMIRPSSSPPPSPGKKPTDPAGTTSYTSTASSPS